MWGGVALVVGEDLKVSQIFDLEGKSLVGKFCGRRMLVVSVNNWMESLLGF
jgi:hypothetical protein